MVQQQQLSDDAVELLDEIMHELMGLESHEAEEAVKRMLKEDRGIDLDAIEGAAYEKGYEKGFEDAGEKEYEDAQEKGFEEGHERGYEDAYEKGYEKGYELGYEKGQEAGGE